MVQFIFLLKTSHLMEHHKISFTIFGSQKQKIWFLQESQKPGFNKRKGGKLSVTNSGSRMSGSSSSRPRRLSPAISPQRWGLRATHGHQRDPQTLANRLTPFFPAAEPPEMACRRPWRLGGGARRYAGALRPVERDLGFPTAPADYGEAS